MTRRSEAISASDVVHPGHPDRPEDSRDLSWLGSLGEIAGHATDLESLVRPLLQILAQLTGLDATYMTFVDERLDVQTLTYTHDAGIPVPEGYELAWTDTLCVQCQIAGQPELHDASKIVPDNAAVTLLGIKGYVSIPFEVVTDDGRTAIIGTLCGASKQPLEPSDDRVRIVELFARLISDRIERERQAEEARERAELAEHRLNERTRFVAAAEHTLKSPLVVLVGWAETLTTRWDVLTDEQRLDGVKRMRESGQKLTERVQELLGEAQSSLVAATLTPRTIKLREAVARDVADYAGVSPKHHVRLLDGPDVDVVADPRALHQVVTHLLENAVKYSPDGGAVDVSVALVDGTAVLTVADRGIGLPDDLDLFAPFERGGHGIEGTGIGLYVVRNLAEAMGGRAAAFSREQGGSVFEVVLPVPDWHAPMSDGDA